MDDRYKLNVAELNLLLTHRGYGGANNSPESVKVLFIGNESGLNGLESVEEYIQSLSATIESKTLIRAKVDANNTPQTRSTFVQFLNRLRLFHECHDPKWLKEMPLLKSEDKALIRGTAWNDGMFHLIDLKPLPRRNEGEEPYDPSTVNMKLYLNAFARLNTSDNSPYTYWVEKRLATLRQLIDSTTNLECIVRVGQLSERHNFARALFPDVSFTPDLNEKSDFFIGQQIVQDRIVKIVFCKFFSHQNGMGYSGLSKLAHIIEGIEHD